MCRQQGADALRAAFLLIAAAAITGCTCSIPTKDDTGLVAFVTDALQKGETEDFTPLLPSDRFLSSFEFLEITSHKGARQLVELLDAHVRCEMDAVRTEAADGGFDWDAARLARVYALWPPPNDLADDDAQVRRSAMLSQLFEKAPIAELLPWLEEFNTDSTNDARTAVLFFLFQDDESDAYIRMRTIPAEGRRVVDPLSPLIAMYQLSKRQ